MTTPTACTCLHSKERPSTGISRRRLVEAALARGEGILAANGAMACDTGAKTGRSPKDKFLEDTPGIHDTIAWGNVNRPVTRRGLRHARAACARLPVQQVDELYRFDGYAGADELSDQGLGGDRGSMAQPVRLDAVHQVLEPTSIADFSPGLGHLQRLQPADRGSRGSTVSTPSAASSRARAEEGHHLGTRYAGEIKKSIFYAMNYDLPDMDVFPMHCSSNVAVDRRHQRRPLLRPVRNRQDDAVGRSRSPVDRG